MDWSDYGPFAATIAIVAALISCFSLLVARTFGRLCRWTWLIHSTPHFVVRAGAQVPAVVVIAMTFLTINSSNYLLFAISSVSLASATVILIWQFERKRKIHVVPIPLTASDGTHARDRNGKLLFTNIVIGKEDAMLPTPANDFAKAKERRHGLSLVAFMGGYGTSNLNDPEAVWSREHLASISSRMTMLLIAIVLTGVLAVYLAASCVEVASRSGVFVASPP